MPDIKQRLKNIKQVTMKICNTFFEFLSSVQTKIVHKIKQNMFQELKFI